METQEETEMPKETIIACLTIINTESLGLAQLPNVVATCVLCNQQFVSLHVGPRLQGGVLGSNVG